MVIHEFHQVAGGQRYQAIQTRCSLLPKKYCSSQCTEPLPRPYGKRLQLLSTHFRLPVTMQVSFTRFSKLSRVASEVHVVPVYGSREVH